MRTKTTRSEMRRLMWTTSRAVRDQKVRETSQTSQWARIIQFKLRKRFDKWRSRVVSNLHIVQWNMCIVLFEWSCRNNFDERMKLILAEDFYQLRMMIVNFQAKTTVRVSQTRTRMARTVSDFEEISTSTPTWCGDSLQSRLSQKSNNSTSGDDGEGGEESD